MNPTSDSAKVFADPEYFSSRECAKLGSCSTTGCVNRHNFQSKNTQNKRTYLSGLLVLFKICMVHLWKRYCQQPRYIILLHFGLIFYF